MATPASGKPREVPLLMRPELVRATLEGRKTQTRRLVTMANSEAHDDAGKATREDWAHMDWSNAAASADGPAIIVPGEDTVACRRTVWRVTPRVRPGHLLWVREPWQVASEDDDTSPALLAPGQVVRYVADGATSARFKRSTTWGRERRGFHMPRWACRLERPVEAVRGELVSAISDEDALAEGVLAVPFQPEDHPPAVGYVLGENDGKSTLYPTPREAFRAGWEIINGDRAPWATAWVWVYQWPRKEPTP